MENQSDAILKQMTGTRSALADKLEALENRVADTIKPVTDSVEHVAEAAVQMADNVKETVHGVSDMVEESVASVAASFNLSKQTENHPWVMFGLAATTGCVLGRMLAPSSSGGRQETRSYISSFPNRSRKDGNGSSKRTPPKIDAAAAAKTTQENQTPSLFQEEMQQLKGLAISSLMGVLRDLARRSLPREVGNRVAQEVDQLTTKLGAQPIQGAVLG